VARESLARSISSIEAARRGSPWLARKSTWPGGQWAGPWALCIGAYSGRPKQGSQAAPPQRSCTIVRSMRSIVDRQRCQGLVDEVRFFETLSSLYKRIRTPVVFRDLICAEPLPGF
jgi:hypothetical protein